MENALRNKKLSKHIKIIFIITIIIRENRKGNERMSAQNETDKFHEKRGT